MSQVEDKVRQFFGQYELQKFDKHQIIIYGGDSPAGIFYLEKGLVRQYDINDNGQEIVVNMFKPLAFFPLIWAINATPNEYFFDTQTAVEVRIAPADKVVEFLKANSDVTFDLVKRLYSGVNGLQRRMAHLMGGNSRSRVLFELVVAGKRFGVTKTNGAIRLEFNEAQLAQMIGLSRESVNRELSWLKQAGLITISHKGITIKDISKIEAELGDTV